MVGLVSRVRYRHGKREYVITDGSLEHPLSSESPLPQGACVAIEGEMSDEAIVASKVSVLSGEQAAAAFERVKEKAARAAAVPDSPSLLDDPLMRKLWPSLRNAASELSVAKKLGRSVLLRFHGDADGIAAAFAISSVIHCKAFQQNSAVYSVRDALRDIAFISQESRPMAVLLDFGSSDPCKEGLDLLAAAGIQCIVIDHHPYNLKGDARIANPFSVQDNSSKYTAGYMACEVAAACGMPRENALALARIACAGDKSDILGSGEDDARKAMVLDFLASHMSFGNNLDFYRKVMDSPELFGSIASQADESIEEAAARALSRAKRSEAGGSEVCVFSLEGIAKRGEWPPSSKITTRVFDKLKSGRPLLCIGYTDRSVIMRLNDEAVALGLSANALAERMKATMGDFVEGGGGHARAGAIRAKKGFVKDVVNQLLREIAERKD